MILVARMMESPGKNEHYSFFELCISYWAAVQQMNYKELMIHNTGNLTEKNTILFVYAR